MSCEADFGQNDVGAATGLNLDEGSSCLGAHNMHPNGNSNNGSYPTQPQTSPKHASAEKSFGFCLVGYVMGPRPNAYALLQYVKNWGVGIKFFFKENGWIKFTFPNESERDRILNGGPHMIMGRLLYLRKLPSWFLFSREDMQLLPSWIQIHGLPADCWKTRVLSRVASVVGKPIHTNQLTITRKGPNYASVLVELDASIPRV